MGQEAGTLINKYANKAQSKILRWLLGFPIVGIAVHWTFQGLIYMDRTERIFKLTLDAIFTLLFGLILDAWLPLQVAWPAALFAAHSLNFLLDAQFWVVMKIYSRVHITFEEYEHYRNGITHRVRAQPCFLFGAIYGSYVRGEWNPCSDLDLRLVRKQGFWNGLRSCSFILFERSRAFFRRFPLDAYVLDSFTPLNRMRDDEIPFILYSQ